MPPTSLRRFLAPSRPKSLSLSGNTTRFYFILFYFILYIFVFSAHYDSRNTNVNDNTGRAPGADDNGSGSSAIIELARVITSLNATFVYSIRFVLFTGEEQGLLGSDAYAEQILSEGTEIVAMFNADMLGYRIPGTAITMGMKDRSITPWLLEVSYAIDALYLPQLPVALSSSCCSDYISFWERGYPAIGFFENPTTASNYPSVSPFNLFTTRLKINRLSIVPHSQRCHHQPRL